MRSRSGMSLLMPIILLFMLLAVVTGVSALLKGPIAAGFAGIVGPILCLFAGAGVRGSFLVGVRSQKIGGLVLGAISLAVGPLLLQATVYRMPVVPIELAWTAWGLAGTAVGLVLG